MWLKIPNIVYLYVQLIINPLQMEKFGVSIQHKSKNIWHVLSDHTKSTTSLSIVTHVLKEIPKHVLKYIPKWIYVPLHWHSCTKLTRTYHE